MSASYNHIMDETIQAGELTRGAEVYLPDSRLVQIKYVIKNGSKLELHFLCENGRFGQKYLDQDDELKVFSGQYEFKADYSKKADHNRQDLED